MLHRISEALWFIRIKYCILITGLSFITSPSVDSETMAICKNPGFLEIVKLELAFDERYQIQFTQAFSKGKARLGGNVVDNNINEFERLRSRDLASSLKRFPSEEICPYLSIRMQSTEDSIDRTTCRTGQMNESECEFIEKYTGKPRSIAAKTCPEDITTKLKPLCWFGKDSRRNMEDLAGLQCNTKPCQPNPVYLGTFNTSLGHVSAEDHWPSFNAERDLEQAIRDTMKLEGANHFRFCFLRCAINQDLNKNLKQILVFPPVLQENSSNTASGININIVVEDAVSRAHFYRSLPKTVDALREIVHDASVSATVLDFEKYQSYDSSTHSNIRRLFAGVSNGSVTTAIKDLYKEFKKAGYRTMYQEDVCWFDGFGSLLRSTRSPQDDPSYQWLHFRQLLDQHIRPSVDTFGVGFSTCQILRDLGDTNIFNGENLPALCFNGHHLSSYFLKTVKDFLDLHKTGSPPVFSYIHLNTGHEHVGRRIVNDDLILAKFVRGMAERSNTLTILLSDHGAKTSEYATRTAHGLKEIYKPFLFMIVPRQVAEYLGNERVKNLIKNQKRLVALEDLNLMLQDFVLQHSQPQSPEAHPSLMSKNGAKRGLFSELSANRNCSAFQLSADAVCQCDDQEIAVELDELYVNFLANIAVGEINNLIQSQYTKLLKITDPPMFAGYGRCQRYELRRVQRVRSKVHFENRLITFTIVVETPSLKKREETFEVTLSYPLAASSKNSFSVVKRTRTSRYSVFKSCADQDVDLQLCTCDHNSSKETPNNGSDYIWKLFSYYMFSRVAKIQKLHGSCLYLIKTRLVRALKNGKGRDVSSLYEVINVCGNQIFNLTVSDDSLVRQPFILSRELPINILVYPNTIYYVVNAFCGLPDGEFMPDIKVDVVDLG